MKIIFSLLSACLLCACSSSRDYTAESVIEAQRKAQRPVPAGAVVSTPDAGPPADRPAVKATPFNYARENDSHWVHSPKGDGLRIKLEDASVWEIIPGGDVKTREWVIAEKITVTRGGNPKYPYTIRNEDRNETVEGRLISQ